MSDLTAAWLALAAQAEAQVAAAAAAYEAAATTRTRFIETAAAAVYVANMHATAYADTAVTAWQLATVGLPTTTLGLLPPPEEQERLIRAFATITAHALAMDTTQRSRRVARSEPLQRGHRAYQDALRARGVEHWRRIAQPDACEDCAPLAGSVHAIEEPFEDHPGCRCTLAPATPAGWGDRQRARQLQLRREWRTSDTTVRLSAGLTIR